MDVNPADLVMATAGRDKNKYFMILKKEDNYVLLCDGRGRTIEKPKLKKIKHIKSLNYSMSRIKEKLETGKKICNSDIRKAIKSALVDLGISED